ncbi:MAG: hypothetical protein AB1349_10675 [Elusimicrobiota bacterium]
MNERKFESGRLFFTRGVNDLIAESIDFSAQVCKSLRRHFSGDWGELDPQDKKANDDALISGERVLSAYNGIKKIWIITEADRSNTTILFPHEY